MGSIWNATVAIDVGIDGNIELCEPGTGTALGIVLLVQSRATESDFQSETDTSFEYLCSERELAYWMQGNAPVLLILSRPKTAEAYWTSIKAYFGDPARRASRRVKFDKRVDRFDEHVFDKLKKAGVTATSGIYLGPPVKSETLVSNLLEVASYGPRVYLAATNLRKADQVWVTKNARNLRGIERPFILREGKILSFNDLRERPWTELCDRGTVEDFDSKEWADADDQDRTNEFIWLLKEALREKLFPAVVFQKDQECYMFRATPDLKPFSLHYQGQGRQRTRDVFIVRTNQRTGKVSWCRHDAFEGNFRRYEDRWFLEINPTYVFTVDGKKISLYQAEYLSNIKRVERNPDVRRQVLNWASYLGRGEDLVTPAYPFLAFGELLSFQVNRGIDDKAWAIRKGKEAPDPKNGQSTLELE